MYLSQDAIYFDAVLAGLQTDGFNQGKCMYRVTEMGQLATEYLDDRKLEYTIIERDIAKDIRIREQSLKEVEQALNFINNDVKFLVRRDEVIKYFLKLSLNEMSMIFAECD